MRLLFSTAGLDPARRYCLVLAAKPVSQATQFAWAKWRSVTLRTDRKPYRQTYRFAHLASLANQIQNADGPIAEAERGFRELSITEGDRFLQTHPMSDRAVAARLHSFAPKGLLRFWTDISIDHPEASATEFGVLLTPRLVTGEFGRFYEESRFAALADDALHVLPDGSLVKKKLLRPGERGWIDITLLEPLRETCHLYLFVKLRGGSAAFGWCRWHRLAMVILAESSQ